MKRKYRLRRNSDFRRVRYVGKSYASPIMVLAFLRNGLTHSRFGFVVSKQLGKAINRNKLKRRMREATRLRLSQIKSGFDIVIIGRQRINRANFAEIERTIEYLLKKADLWL